MSSQSTPKSPAKLAYIGCWYKNDMYAHNCSHLVDSLRASDLTVDVVTSNCRCFTSSHRFGVAKDELITRNCSAIGLPHVPVNPSKKYGLLKYYAVKALRLDIWFAAVRGVLYYMRSRQADVIHFDQVLEAFGAIPLFVVIGLGSITQRRLIANVHEVDPFQRNHKWLNVLYNRCSEVLVYSENMKRELVQLGVSADKIRTIRYGATIPSIGTYDRKRYIYFGGHHILKGKGYRQLIEALAMLKERGRSISVLSYVAHGCNGLAEAKRMAEQLGVASMIEWADFCDSERLTEAYQKSKACVIPYASGSARHPVTCAMANATPIVATSAVDIREYVGDVGIYVDGSSDSIARAIEEIEEGKYDLTAIGAKSREKAQRELDYSIVAQGLAAIYGEISPDDGLVRITPAV